MSEVSHTLLAVLDIYLSALRLVDASTGEVVDWRVAAVGGIHFSYSRCFGVIERHADCLCLAAQRAEVEICAVGSYLQRCVAVVYAVDMPSVCRI